MKAECQCGQLTLTVPEHPLLTVACHCRACQRRTGAPFGVQYYYWSGEVAIAGEAKPYRRVSDDGNNVETHFCPHCGSTVFLRLARQPDLIGVAVGAIAEPALSAPMWSIWEEAKHPWVSIDGAVKHFPRGDEG